MIFKWLHNRKNKYNPLCNCGWRMLPMIKIGYDYMWKCKWEKCGWETYEGTSGKLHWYKKNEKKA